MKLDFSMAKAGDKYIGELEFQRPDGEYDVWTIVKRLDPSVAGSSPKGYPIYLIGTATNSGLLSDYYYKPERGESESKSLEEINADLEVLAQDGESYMSRVKRIPKKGLKKNPPFYAHNLYEKKTHGLTLKQMRRLYAMVSRGNQKAITYARNVLGIPFSESPTQVKAVVYHHVRDLAERRVRRNGRRACPTPRFVGKGDHVWRQLSQGQKLSFLMRHFPKQITPMSQHILSQRSFQFLPKNVKMAVEAKYANMEPEEYLRENPRGSRDINPFDYHRKKIALRTVKFPMEGYFLGGPDLAESVRYLRSLGYSMAQLKKLNPEVEDILEGRKSILPNRRVGRNPFGGETLRSFKQKYKGFEIIVEIQPNTVLATWTNGDILESDRFSGYELDEIFEEVKARIDALKRRRK